MGTPLTAADFAEAFRTFTSTAFRLELQAAYSEPIERETLAKFLAGEPEPPTEVPAFQAWLEQVKGMASEGRRIERVRVHEDPPTDYQRWERWVGNWNVEAGEVIHYLTRRQAEVAGLLPVLGTEDWWLFDSSRLIVMRFDDQHRRISDELFVDAEHLERARAWRDLAVLASTGHAPVASI
jgi:hypothetical protein